MKRLKSTGLTRLAKGKPCVRCGETEGVVGCHYSGKYSRKLGKGYGIKAQDIFLAYLCHKCHNYFDSYENRNKDERAAEFMLCILLSLEVSINTGELELTINGKKLQGMWK